MPVDQAELDTEQVLKRDIPWETYMTTELITETGLQLLKRYDKSLKDKPTPPYVRVFVIILSDISKEDNVKYVPALIDEMLTEDLLKVLNQLEKELKVNIKKLSSFEKYKQEANSGHFERSPMHKDPTFWSESVTNFEDMNFEVLRVLIAIPDKSDDLRALVVACFDLSQFIPYHPAGRIMCKFQFWPL
ncbi:hypothetical protein RJ639_038413 [Escallonia herrerae]|uniref:ATPase V1 complex subunit H C-terminal domain-containing protein n=1 Tax=Escallonia herrerae TaxID=1293975 RepID=A0AA88WZ86_9ASTE|nr:hypothetical protein RJ639_038413 [Escallonia herrerae]